MDHDSVVKKDQFIDISVAIRSIFDWAAPADVVKTLKIYCSALYGSMLWDLGGEKASEVYSAWDTAIKLVQVLSCGDISARTDILSRYGQFFRGLKNSVSQEVRVRFNFVARDLTTSAKKLKVC